jgi:hypothetical protein
MAGFDICSVEPSGSAATMLVNYDNVHLLNLMEYVHNDRKERRNCA